MPADIILIAGLGTPTGKTALAAGLLHHWMSAGKRVAYVRLGGDEAGARAMAGLMDLEPARSLCPEPAALKQGLERLPATDVAVVEADGSADAPGWWDGLREAAGGVAVRLLLLVRYHQHLGVASILDAARRAGPVTGVIVNFAPPRSACKLQEGLGPELSKAGVRLFGVIPESRALYGFTVGELHDHLGAEYLCLPNKRDGLVETLMLGGNPPDPAYSYFAPKPNKAVFCRIDRPDIQYAALDAGPQCIIVTGQGSMVSYLVYRAEDQGVPVLHVKTDTIATIQSLDGLVEGLRFNQRAKVPVARALVEQHLDLTSLES